MGYVLLPFRGVLSKARHACTSYDLLFWRRATGFSPLCFGIDKQEAYGCHSQWLPKQANQMAIFLPFFT